jgi:hypothetical protein
MSTLVFHPSARSRVHDALMHIQASRGRIESAMHAIFRWSVENPTSNGAKRAIRQNVDESTKWHGV